ncbi:HD domain protein [Orientia tsutsugamushi str. Gilliam]|uniref:HD domain protein n=1 Tax=Orientia tsutsugamushi str. Gilliam TaxID=1359184 RepID=A0A0F3M8I8_ORITS|nr:HD domain protein [Orientia tsutsugamushi str. Gilliam]
MIDFYSESLLNKLFETNVRFNTEIDLDKVEKAIFYAQKYHGQQKRDTGEPYYMHPLEVARMVGYYSFETDTIITAILHDTLEDTTLTKEKIGQGIWYNIAEQVSDLTRIKDNKKLVLER